MWTASASVPNIHTQDRVELAVRQIEEDWQNGRPDLARVWASLGTERTVSDLAALVKIDLRCRFSRGEQPVVSEYLAIFPELREQKDRMLSLIYEEFCLLEESGDRPDVAEFCERYASWKDSLASQLRYHSMFSQVVGAQPVPRFPEPGDHFQEFALCEELGRGGSARVFRATDEMLGGREVALKIYPDRGKEASILGRLDHAHIVPVHSTPYQAETKLRGLCMPYRPGVALDELIRKVNPSSKPKRASVISNAVISEADCSEGTGWQSFPSRSRYVDGVAWIILKIAEAVAHAHSRRIEHRDVKPANIRLTSKDGPQLLDFNLAHDQHSPEQAEAALRGGTLPYMAPEQLEAFIDEDRWKAVDARADLYSLGLVLREFLTGEAPELPDPSLKAGRAIRDMLDRRARFRPNLRRLDPRIPRSLDSITNRCLAYRAEDRYQTAAELADDLRRFLARRPLEHAANPSGSERVSNWASRNRIVICATMATILGLLLFDPFTHAVITETAPVPPGIESLEAGPQLDSLRAIRDLSAREPSSPVILAYLAMAESQEIKDLNVAATHLSEAWRIPSAGPTLLEWGKSHSAFKERATNLVVTFLKKPTDYFQWTDERIRNWTETLELVLTLDSNNTKALHGLGTIHEKRHEYEKAHKILDRLIAGVTHSKSPDGRKVPNGYLKSRARVSTAWAEALLLDKPENAEIQTIETLLKNAIADLDAVDEPRKPGVIEPRDGDYIRAETCLDLGIVMLRKGEKATALEWLGQSERLCALVGKVADWSEKSDELSNRIQAALKQAR